MKKEKRFSKEQEVRKLEKSSLWYTSSPDPPREANKR
jgi:hypothetical protein